MRAKRKRVWVPAYCGLWSQAQAVHEVTGGKPPAGAGDLARWRGELDGKLIKLCRGFRARVLWDDWGDLCLLLPVVDSDRIRDLLVDRMPVDVPACVDPNITIEELRAIELWARETLELIDGQGER